MVKLDCRDDIGSQLAIYAHKRTFGDVLYFAFVTKALGEAPLIV
jgi:hypothetical protein